MILFNAANGGPYDPPADPNQYPVYPPETETDGPRNPYSPV